MPRREMIDNGSSRPRWPSVKGRHRYVSEQPGIPDVELRTAVPPDATRISELAFRSKAHWGYDAQFMAACRDDLTVHAEECDGERVVVAVHDDEIIGYYHLKGTPPSGELADLFVDPSAIGSGVGGLLYRDAVTRARQLGFRELTLDADPHAEDFYLHMGAVRIGEVPSTAIPGRSLPQLRADLTDAGHTHRGAAVTRR